jgi:plastocyanin
VLSSVTESSGLVEIPASTPVRAGESVRFIPYTELLD